MLSLEQSKCNFRCMRNRIFFVIVFSLLSPFVTAQALTDGEKDKVLFMIFENQNKKIVFDKKIICPKGVQPNWICQSPTIKQFLINTMRIQGQNPAQTTNNLYCEAVSTNLQKTVESQPRVILGALDFRREIRESLPGQWLCVLSVEQSLAQGVEAFEDASVFKVNDDGSAYRKVGISFLMNRDKSRIVSRRAAGWVEPIIHHK